MRIGFGYDVHKFSKGRKLILGGVHIPHSKGLLGHSDADVLVHAVCDAMLGAAGLKDIGHYFPNKDRKWKDISSLILLKECHNMLTKKKLNIINIDCTLLLEVPKINPYVDEMKKNLCNVLKIKENQLAIKSTTNEGLGYIGTKKGCSAYAVCSLK